MSERQLRSRKVMFDVEHVGAILPAKRIRRTQSVYARRAPLITNAEENGHDDNVSTNALIETNSRLVKELLEMKSALADKDTKVLRAFEHLYLKQMENQKLHKRVEKRQNRISILEAELEIIKIQAETQTRHTKDLISFDEDTALNSDHPGENQSTGNLNTGLRNRNVLMCLRNVQEAGGIQAQGDAQMTNSADAWKRTNQSYAQIISGTFIPTQQGLRSTNVFENDKENILDISNVSNRSNLLNESQNQDDNQKSVCGAPETMNESSASSVAASFNTEHPNGTCARTRLYKF